MKRLAILAGAVICVVGAVIGGITLYDYQMKHGRMWETPGVKPHESPIPMLESGLVPIEGGETIYRLQPAERVVPPFDLRDPFAVEQGKKGYGYYCVHCHGKHHDGAGKVGQSFSPLPGDLRGKRVQGLEPGRIFKEISHGIPGGRQPALAGTIAVEDRWKIVAYVKSLGIR